MMKPLYRKRKMMAAFAVLFAATTCAGRSAAFASVVENEPVASTEEKTTQDNEQDKEEKEPSGADESTSTPEEESSSALEEETEKDTEEKNPDTEITTTESPTEEGKEEETKETEEPTTSPTEETTTSPVEEESRTPEPNDRPTETEAETPEETETGTEIESSVNLDEKPGMNAPTSHEDLNIINVIVPVTYVMALNPYGFEVDMGNNVVSTDQVLSRNYGIVNKGSKDMVVTVSLTVEEKNGGGIRFVDTAEEALYAEEDNCALYLAVVPAEGEIRAGGMPIDKDVDAAALSDVTMTKAENRSRAIHEGKNEIVFQLSKAKYNPIESVSDDREGEMSEPMALADDGASVSAFTFSGAMNDSADWSKVPSGIRMSVVYTYEVVEEEKETSIAMENEANAD